MTAAYTARLLKVVRQRPRGLNQPYSLWTLQRFADSPGEVFYYVDEFNVSWLPTLRHLWSPKGQQVRIPTPGQSNKRYGIGGVNYQTGETVTNSSIDQAKYSPTNRFLLRDLLYSESEADSAS